MGKRSSCVRFIGEISYYKERLPEEIDGFILREEAVF